MIYLSTPFGLWLSICMSVRLPACHSSCPQKLLKWLANFSQNSWGIKTSPLLRSREFLESRHLAWSKRLHQCLGWRTCCRTSWILMTFHGITVGLQASRTSENHISVVLLFTHVLTCAFTVVCYKFRLCHTAGWKKSLISSKFLVVNKVTADLSATASAQLFVFLPCETYLW